MTAEAVVVVVVAAVVVFAELAAVAVPVGH